MLGIVLIRKVQFLEVCAIFRVFTSSIKRAFSRGTSSSSNTIVELFCFSMLSTSQISRNLPFGPHQSSPRFHPLGISSSHSSQSPPLHFGQARGGETQGLGPACKIISANPLPPHKSQTSGCTSLVTYFSHFFLYSTLSNRIFFLTSLNGCIEGR